MMERAIYFSFKRLVKGLIGGIICCCMLSSPSEILAQKRMYQEDVAYLKNGSIIRGKIKAQVPRESVTIETYDGMIFELKTADIDYITIEPSQYNKIRFRYDYKVMPYVYPGPGWYSGIEIATSGNDTHTSLFLEGRMGYRWKHWLQTGIVTGLNPYSPGLIVPLAAELRADLLRKRISPFLYGQGGYGFVTRASRDFLAFRGGWMYQYGAGVTIRNRQKRDYQLGIGYKWQGSYQTFEELVNDFRPGFGNQMTPVLISGNRNYRRITLFYATYF